MSRNLVSLSFSIIFLAFLLAPTVIAMMDDSKDVSMFFTSTEEEEKSIDKNKEVEVLFFEIENHQFDNLSLSSENNLAYRFKNYPKPHLNLISPPPDSNIF